MAESYTSTTTTKWPGLNQVAPIHAHWSRLLHDRRFLAALLRKLPHIALSTVDEPSTDLSLAVELYCDKDAASIELDIGEADHPSFAMAMGEETSNALRHIATQVLLAPVMDALELLGCGLWRPIRSSLRSASLSQSSDTASPWLCLRRGPSVLATLRVTRAPLGWTENFRERLCSYLSAPSYQGSWELPARVTLHQRSYGRNLLSSLATGDVLVLPCSAPLAAERSVVIHWGATTGRRLSMSGRLSGGKVIVEGVHSVINDESEQEAAVAEVRPILGVGDIEVPVRFELETVPVSLTQIDAIAPGYVIELTSSLEQASLRLVVCGQVIALAELVAVGDKLGARITRLGA
jgi:type III secretion protein Q